MESIKAARRARVVEGGQCREVDDVFLRIKDELETPLVPEHDLMEISQTLR